MEYKVGSKVSSVLLAFDIDPMEVRGFNAETNIYELYYYGRLYYFPAHTIRPFKTLEEREDELLRKRVERYKIQQNQNKQPVQLQERERYNAFERH